MDICAHPGQNPTTVKCGHTDHSPNCAFNLGSGRVHGDYSTFNILWHNGKAVVIDFPQVLEFKHNPNARAFLERDIRSLCKSFQKQGVQAVEANVLREIRTA